MKKKIGIITLVDYNNYGNRLQNYATHRILSSMGYEVETIDYNIQQNKVLISKIRRVSKLPLKQIIRQLSKKINRTVNNEEDKRRINIQRQKESNFKEFSSKHICEFKFIIKNNADLEYLNKRYDYFVVGSDQVWNPYFFNGSTNTELNFLSFASKHKRIAFSASFGIDYIPENYSSKFTKWLSGMEHISVREDSGRDIVEKLSGRESKVLVDPTLVLTKKEWLEISKPIDIDSRNDYIVTYLIGDEAEYFRNIVKKYASKNGLKVINLFDYSDDRYTIDPSEFISYINNAEMVFTNSFHGTIFSIIFEKPFIVFNRIGSSASMNTRIDTLLSKFNYKERLRDDLENTEGIYNMDFSHTYQIIQCEREKVYKYLKDSLQAEDTLDYES